MAGVVEGEEVKGAEEGATGDGMAGVVEGEEVKGAEVKMEMEVDDPDCRAGSPAPMEVDGGDRQDGEMPAEWGQRLLVDLLPQSCVVETHLHSHTHTLTVHTGREGDVHRWGAGVMLSPPSLVMGWVWWCGGERGPSCC